MDNINACIITIICYFINACDLNRACTSAALTAGHFKRCILCAGICDKQVSCQCFKGCHSSDCCRSGILITAFYSGIGYASGHHGCCCIVDMNGMHNIHTRVITSICYRIYSGDDNRASTIATLTAGHIKRWIVGAGICDEQVSCQPFKRGNRRYGSRSIANNTSLHHCL